MLTEKVSIINHKFSSFLISKWLCFQNICLPSEEEQASASTQPVRFAWKQFERKIPGEMGIPQYQKHVC